MTRAAVPGLASSMLPTPGRMVVLAVPANAQQPVLEVDIGGEPLRVDDPVDAAVHHDGDPARHRGGNPDVLLDHEDGDLAALGEPDQDLLDLGDDYRREAFGRLVHDEQARIEQQRPRDRQHLLLAAGQFSAAMAPARGKLREGLVDALDGPAAALRSLHQAKVLVHGQRRPQPAPLRDVTDAEPRDLGRPAPRQLLAEEPNRSARTQARAP